jgi:hypothetical protein
MSNFQTDIHLIKLKEEMRRVSKMHILQIGRFSFFIRAKYHIGINIPLLLEAEITNSETCLQIEDNNCF